MEDNNNQKVKKLYSRVKRKLGVMFFVVFIIFVLLIARITYIAATKGNRYKKQVLEQQNYSSRVIPFKRGSIKDRNGNLLAFSKNVYNVILDAKALNETPKKISKTKDILNNIFGIKRSDVEKALKKHADSRYIILLKNVEYETAKKFIALEEDSNKSKEYAGVWLEDNYVRTYPYNEFASNVIGFTADGNVGVCGIEQYYNNDLNGTNGREYGYLTPKTNIFERSVKLSKNGNDIVSTIDINVQKIIEDKVNKFNETYKDKERKGLGANHISVVAMDPNNGEILGMESFPNFDLNNPNDLERYLTKEEIDKLDKKAQREYVQNTWKNFFVSDAYEPGSTAKPFTIATGLEDGKLSGLETYSCYGSLKVGDREIHCHEESGHGMQTLKDAIANSCNVALMNASLTIGKDEFLKYQHIFGFGKKTNIDLPGENAGSIYTLDKMTEVDLASNSFGQNFTCTGIQMVSAYCSLINGGNYYKPCIVKEIQDESGNAIKENSKQLVRKTVSKKTSKTLDDYMLATVTHGTGKTAGVLGYDLAGKTGTAETLPRGNDEYIISFCGFAPSNDPQILIYAVIDRPNYENQEATSLVMGLVHDICVELFPYLQIPTNNEISN